MTKQRITFRLMLWMLIAIVAAPFAAVQAIEDVVAGDYGKYTDGDDCSHGKLEAEVCEYCIREHLILHLQSLKGLIDV